MADLYLLLHDEESTPGSTVRWCEARGVRYEIKVAPREKDLAALRPARGTVVFGGDMEVWDAGKYPWLANEKLFLRGAVERGDKVFGICLGAQLLAEQMGSVVAPMREEEIGWFPVELENGESLTPLHWHSSTFTQPGNARLLATSASTRNQGFAGSPRHVGYQFHTEIDSVRLAEVLARWRPTGSSRQQSADQIRGAATRHMNALQEWYFRQLDLWWGA